MTVACGANIHGQCQVITHLQCAAYMEPMFGLLHQNKDDVTWLQPACSFKQYHVIHCQTLKVTQVRTPVYIAEQQQATTS